MSVISDEQLIKIKNRIHKKVNFYSHFGAYIIVCVFLTFLDYFDKSRAGLYSIDWVYWVWLGWGIAVAFDFLNAFILPNYKEQIMQKELDKKDKW